ncbi:hypothetical protein F2Q69_00044360 [Brassica cretica]|uniref:Uncharacterized protein n=1 Tax=Brassica cretica TaxID=69181 RepID=A0A8S9NJW2_BRACR|nr:hypothetical protein F2Q69_00044360 [Brassica cretica]
MSSPSCRDVEDLTWQFRCDWLLNSRPTWHATCHQNLYSLSLYYTITTCTVLSPCSQVNSDALSDRRWVLGGCSQKEMGLFLVTTCVNVLVVGSKLSSMADCGLLFDLDPLTPGMGLNKVEMAFGSQWSQMVRRYSVIPALVSPFGFCLHPRTALALGAWWWQRYVSENISYGRLVRHGQRRYKLCGEHRELATSETTRELPASEDHLLNSRAKNQQHGRVRTSWPPLKHILIKIIIIVKHSLSPLSTLSRVRNCIEVCLRRPAARERAYRRRRTTSPLNPHLLFAARQISVFISDMLAILRARGTDRFSILSLPRARVVDEGMVSLPLEAPMRGFDGFFSAMGVLGGCSQKEMELFLGTTCVNVLVIGSKLSSMADCGLLARTLHFGFLIHGSISSYSWDGDVSRSS